MTVDDPSKSNTNSPSSDVTNTVVSATTSPLNTIPTTSPSPNLSPSPTDDKSLAQLDYNNMTKEENDTIASQSEQTESFLGSLRDKSDT